MTEDKKVRSKSPKKERARSKSPTRTAKQEQSEDGSVDDKRRKETPPLPDGWTEHLSKSSGKYYYYNAADGTTSWDRPSPPETAAKIEDPTPKKDRARSKSPAKTAKKNPKGRSVSPTTVTKEMTSSSTTKTRSVSPTRSASPTRKQPATSSVKTTTVTRNKESPDSKVGISFGPLADGRFELTKINDGGLFDGSGIHAGQELVSVHGAIIRGIDMKDVVAMLASIPKEVTLQVGPPARSVTASVTTTAAAAAAAATTVTRNKESPDSRVGICFGPRADGRFFITKINDTSMFADSGLFANQELVSINGTPVRGKDTKEVAAILASLPKEVTLQVGPDERTAHLRCNLVEKNNAVWKLEFDVAQAVSTIPAFLQSMGVTQGKWKRLIRSFATELVPATQQFLIMIRVLDVEMSSYTGKQMGKGGSHLLEGKHEKKVFLMTQQLAMQHTNSTLVANNVLSKANSLLNGPHGIMAELVFAVKDLPKFTTKVSIKNTLSIPTAMKFTLIDDDDDN